MINKLLKIFIPLALGVLILYFLYRKTDFHELWQYIKSANWWILSFSLLFGLLGNVFRGLRWGLLITPLGYRPQTLRLVYTVLGSYAVNFVIPRAGEIWRCGVVSKNEKIPVTKLIGTILIDRLFDVVMVVLFLLVAFICNLKVFYKNRDLFNLPDWITSPTLYVCLGLAALVCLSVLLFFKNNKMVRNIRKFFTSMGKDMLQVWKMKTKRRFFLYTFGIWIAYFFYFYITFYAFDFTASLGIAAGLFVFVVSSISMSIPSNGGLGPWQAAVVFGLCTFMVNIEHAKAFATAVFAFQSIWLVACGLFGITMLSVGKQNSRPTPVSDSHLN